MKAYRAIAIAIAAAASLAATWPAASQTAPRRTTAFDGIWSVSIITRAGPCDASYRYPARIFRGQVLPTDDSFGFQLAGVVANNGMIVVTVSQGGQSATGRGRLYASTGRGQWSTAGGQCSGVWSAMRRNL